MKNISGIWEGEFSLNHGTENEPDIEYNLFRLELEETDDVITGKGEVLTLDNEPFEVNGFVDEGFINFILKYRHLIYQDEERNYFRDESSQHPDVSYSGNYDDKEEAYVGIWELTVKEEPEGLQTMAPIICNQLTNKQQ